MAQHTFDYALFQEQFPAFASSPSSATLTVYFAIAGDYLSFNDVFGGLSGDTLQFALNCLTAHQAQIANMIAAGQTTVGIMTASSIDKISVSLMAPPVRDGFEYWLMTTPYGMQLLALLQLKSAGGWYVGPRIPERRAFRKAYGTFR